MKLPPLNNYNTIRNGFYPSRKFDSEEESIIPMIAIPNKYKNEPNTFKFLVEEGDIPNPCPNNKICIGIGDHEDQYICCPINEKCTTDNRGFPICISEQQWLTGRLAINRSVADPYIGELIDSFVLGEHRDVMEFIDAEFGDIQ